MMTFTCTHCDKPIHGVGAVQNGNFMHHRCSEEYQKAKELEEQKKEIED